MTNNLALFFAIQSSMGRYLHALENIYDKFQAKHCFIGKFIDDENVRTLLHLLDGQEADNFVYQLQGTPCAEAKKSLGTCCYNTGVQACFPDDIALVDWDIDSYIAVTIRSFEDKPVGILVCLFDHPIDVNASDKAWFREVGYLIGAEFKYEFNQAENRHLINQMAAGESLAKLCTIEWRPGSGQLFCSAYAYEMLAIEKEQEITIDQLIAMVDKRDIDSVNKSINKVVAKDELQFELKFSIISAKNERKYLHILGESYRDELSEELVVMLSVQDITAQYQLNKYLTLSDIVFEHTSEAVMITDKNNQIIKVNNALEQLTGFEKSELLGHDPAIFSSGQQGDDFYKNMWHCLENSGSWRGEIYNKRKNGEIFPEELSLSVVKDSYGEVANYVAVFRDISEWKKTEERLTFYANKESLTGLANRRAFIESIDKHVQFGERFNIPFAVLFIDVNRFKEINDIYGHDLGDKLLITIGRRIVQIVHNSDFVCRYGGDEFTVLLPEYSAEQAYQLAEQIQHSLNSIYNFDKLSLDVSVSLGLAQYPDSGINATELLRSANYAMSRVKAAGKLEVGIHDKALQDQYLRKLALRDKLKAALEQKQLTVYYQPIICAKTQKIKKFEALVRWFDGLFGFISPGEFIPIAEEFGLISTLGQFVLEKACEDLKQLHNLGYDHIAVSINRSINEFRVDNDQVNLVQKAIKDSGLPTNKIELEVTESIAMSSNVYVKKALQTLKDSGIKIALDDFCTGFSSLSNLIDYPADVLKIDKSFVDKILTHNQHSLLTQTLIELADKLGMEVVGEGVEELAQLERLREYGCHHIQGYYYSPAVDIEECKTLLAKES